MDGYTVLALTLAGLLLLTFGAMRLAHRPEPQTRPAPVVRTSSQVGTDTVADPACPGPDMGTLSWLIWDGLDR